MIKILLFLTLMNFSVFAYAVENTEIIVLTPEQEKRFMIGLTDPRINFVRKTLDKCVATNLSADNCEVFRRSNIDVKDITGKFLLYRAQDVVTGGFGMAVIFIDNPNKMFNAIVRTDGSLRMHQFYRVKVPPGVMEKILLSYSKVMKMDHLLK